MRRIALGLVLALVAVTQASAQGTTDGIKLSGFWKMEDDRGYVFITHRGTTVKGEFYLGGQCFDGKEKLYPIEGKISTTITPAQITYSLTGKLWVCTGTPSLVEQCGGSISSAYETTIIDATVEPNRIAGTRVAQGVLNCRPNSAWDGVRGFALTRHACTEQEFEVAVREDYLRFLQRQVTENLDVFVAAHSAARARYGDTFTVDNTSWLTNWLQIPYFELRGDYPSAEAFFEHLRQVLVVNPDRWLSARTTALLMARDRLTQAADMVRRISEIEETESEARTTIEELEKLRKELDSCRRANPSASTAPAAPR